ncbi:MAG: LamG domain-containing protein [Pleurocapsa sp. MO_192.B19]|nr:LamG domain-containing protein [Pleurocapsa sp. MO_192.B19]
MSHLWDTVSIGETVENQFELSWQDSINLTALFGASDFLPDVGIENPTFTITEEASGNSYGFAGDINVGGQEFAINASFTLEDINGISSFSWDNIALPRVSLDNLTSLLGNAVSGLDSFFGSDTKIDLNISETGAELAWGGDINLTSLFGLGGSFPDLTVGTPSFAIATENNTTTYEFAGDIKLSSGNVGFSSSFVQENVNGSSEFSWQEIAIDDFALNSVTELLGSTISGLDSFFGSDTTIDINISEDEAELAWNDEINLTSLFGLDDFLPQLSVGTPTFAIALEEESTTYEFAGDITVGNQEFPMEASFTSEDINGVSNFSWDNIAIPDVSLSNLTSLLGDAVSGLDSFFGNNTTIDINISEDGAELAWDDDINLTSLFGLDGFLPQLSVDTPTFAIALEEESTTYEFAGDITVGNGETFGLSSSFVQEEADDGSSEFSWSEIEISEFDLDNITDLLGNSFAGVGNFFDNNLPNLPAVTVGITEDEVELTLAEDIDVSSLLKLNSFLPGLNLSIANPSFAIATENNTNTYELAGDFSVLGETFNLSTSFTQESAGGALKWQDISIPNFSIGTLTGMMGGAFTQVDDVFGDALPEIDVTITQSELGFGSAIDFASSNNQYLQWIHNKLDIDTLDVDFIYDTSGSISLDAGVTGEFELVSTKDLDAFLTNVALSFDVDYSGSSFETSLSLDAGARLDIKDSAQTSLDLSGGISFAVGTGGFEAEGYFALDAGQAGWDNPFGLPDSSIRSFGLSLGIGGVTGLDSFGIRGDLQFGNYDFDAAFSIDLTNPDEFALAATLNESISVLDLISGPAASYALGQAANNVGFIDDAKDIMDQVLDVDVVSIDSDGDGALDPLIYVVPEDTEIAGKLYEQGFSINAAVSAWGKDASLYFNANAETGEISGGLDIDKINIEVDNTTILKIEGSDFADDNGKGTIVGGTVTEADKYIDQSNNGTIVGDANVGGEGNDGTFVGNATVSEEGSNGTLIDGTITDGIFELDGNNDYVRISGNADFDGITQEITVETWIKVDSFDRTWQAIVTQGDDSWRLHRYKNTNQLNFAINGLGSITGSTNVNDGEWHHVAAVYNGSQMRLYVDGQLDAQRNVTGTIPISNYDVLIGENAQRRNRYFEGQIDDVRIWNQGRTEAEIIANYQSTLNGNEAGLVAHWNFEEESVEGNIVQDVTANSVLKLDGSGDYVKVANASELSLTDGTIEFRVTPDWAPGEKNFNPAILANRDTTGTNYSIHLRRNLDGIDLWNGSQVRTVAYNFQQGVEYHVALVESGTNTEVFINGVSQGIMNRGFSGRQGLDFHIGSSNGTREFFEGTIDDVRVWSTVRSAAEISDNYQNSLTGEEAGLVAYWNFEEESVEGNTVKDVTAKGVLNLDGSGDYVNITSDRLLNLSDNSAFTLEAWINPNHDDNRYHGFIGSQGSNVNQRTPGMWVVNQTGITFGFGDGSSWTQETANNVLTPDSWNHVATTFDGVTYTLYINGEAVHSTDKFAGKTPYASDQLTIGRVAGTGSYFQGEMDEVRVWDIARSAAEIGDHYQNSLTGEEAGLVAYWNFENESVEGNTVQDVAENQLEFTNSNPDGVLQLDGTDDYVNVSSDRTLDLSINKTFTLEAWINPDHDDNGFHGFIGSQGSNINERTPGMWVVNQTGITFGFGEGSNNSWKGQTVNNVLTPDSWNHVATTFDGRTYTLYVNGETVYSTDAFAGKTPYGSDSLTIGKVAGSFFQGGMDEVRVWDIARSASQIETYFQQPLTGEERGLVGYWNFDGDSVNGDTVKDLAAGDDNLNLDFKLSDIDSYLRGDGKITFLGESIDVYVEAGSNGLEFAMATDNGTLTTDLAIVLDKSGFAASGSVDLDISADINLPFGLGKVSLVDLEVNTDASISVDQSGFASSFSGSLSINNKNINFDIDIDVAFSSVEDLYNKLEAKIIQEIKDSAKDIFSNVTEWANAIADGTVEFAGDVADVAVAAYDATEEAFIEAAETLGQTADDIVAGLSNTYSATKDEVAGFLNDAGYTSSAIADALIAEFNATATDITQALNSIGSTASDVATILDSKFTFTASQMASTLESSFDVGEDAMAAILDNAGYASSAIADALIAEFNATATDITQALNSIGSTASDVAIILDSKFTLTASQMASTLESSFDVGEDAMATILNNAGYASSAIADALIAEFNATATDITQALNSIGSTASDVATILDSKFTLTANQMASTLESSFDVGEDAMAAILNNAGYTSSAIADALICELNATATDVTQALNSIGSTASDVATILDSKFTLTANQMASTLESSFNVGGNAMAKILKDTGYGIDTVLSSVKSFYNLTATPSARALNYAGYTIDEMANAINFGAQWTTIAFKNVGFAVNDIAEAFKDAGRGVDFIASGIRQAYGHSAATVANILADVSYSASEVAQALNKAYNLSDAAMANALEYAGYGADATIKAFKGLDKSANSAISNVKSAFNTNIDDMAKGLNAAGYVAGYDNKVIVSRLLKSSYGADARELGRALNSGYTSLSNDDLANILEDSGFNLDSVGKFFKKDLGLSKSNAKSALKSAFKNGRVNDWIKDVWDKIESIFPN